MTPERAAEPNAAITIKAWRICDEESCIFCRAETRNAARRFWPGDTSGFRDCVMRLRVTREPRLDGPGPLDYIKTVWIPCACGDLDGCGECFEGERLDWDATIAAQQQRDERSA